MSDSYEDHKDYMRTGGLLRDALASTISMKQNFCTPAELAEEVIQAIADTGYVIVHRAKADGAEGRAGMTKRSPYLTVTFQASRQGLAALLKHLETIPETYTDLGETAATACEALRAVLKGDKAYYPQCVGFSDFGIEGPFEVAYLLLSPDDREPAQFTRRAAQPTTPSFPNVRGSR